MQCIYKTKIPVRFAQGFVVLFFRVKYYLNSLF